MQNQKQALIGIASDHAGYELKGELIQYLQSMGYETIDYGTHSTASCDYPEFAHALASQIEKQELNQGIAICGSGNGINMTCNKYAHVRAALCWSPEIATLARQHNDANICTLPARYIDRDTAMEILKQFLSTPFEGGRHLKRVEKISTLLASF